MYIFAIILCFLKEKTNKAVSSDIAETDNMPPIMIEAKLAFKNFIVNLWFNSQYLLNSNALMGSW